MTTKLEVISTANVLLGSEIVTDLAEVPEQVAIFDSMFLSFLQSNTWKFATKRLPLSKLVDEPLYEFKNQFELPADFLRLVGFKDYVLNYSINGNRILTDNEEMTIEYIGIVEVDECPPNIVKSLEYQMASDIALYITEDPAKARLFAQLADKQRKEAAGVDVVQGRTEPVYRSQFEAARRSGYTDISFINKYYGGR